MSKQLFRKGDRVEYTWPNFGEPTTKQGRITIAHRDGVVTVRWDGDRRPQWWPSPDNLNAPLFARPAK